MQESLAFVAGYVVFMLAAAGDRSGFVEVFPSHEPPLPTLSQPVAGDDFALTGLPLSFDGVRPAIRRGAPRLGADNGAYGMPPATPKG